MPSQCTVSYAGDMTTKGTPGRMVRIEDDVWADYGQLCEEEGTSRADDIRRHVHARVTAWRRAHGIAAPKRKVVVRRKKPAADSD